MKERHQIDQKALLFLVTLASNELALAYFNDLHHCRPKIGQAVFIEFDLNIKDYTIQK